MRHALAFLSVGASLLVTSAFSQPWTQGTPEERARMMQRSGEPLDASWLDITPDPSLKGWTRLSIPPEQPLASKNQWRVENRVLVCDGSGGHEWLRWDRELGDFVLQAEWRFHKLDGEPRYNSGIFVRNTRDGLLWHQAQTGMEGGYLFGRTLVGGKPGRLNLRDRMQENRVRPAGEWNLYEIRCQGGTISLAVNGERVSEFTECELPSGYLGLEAEGFHIEFRNLRVKQLGPERSVPR